VVLVFTNSCINPFIYAAKYHEFQQGVKRLVTLVACRSRQQPASSHQVQVHPQRQTTDTGTDQHQTRNITDVQP